ncbi:MAG: hypothetical protein HOA08_00985 [Rhodospirillaceae bacterium]|jgi:hypothetical protein|nr:hypothetical protein [Rhodospirillaceae bacterium]MBT3492063.1 hypothetical protein [Rhodospirillaceae bacterium]MBT3781632.1 hypothetical protein [Rhodospirillaceae bacterium]MBT3979442.1 hypothetical protein [Rhodospirillaceae bacterium]MBT4169930.1 hypothetical protein [Rhodospirillaceae bacterium]
MKYYLAYFLLLVMVVGLPVAILFAPWNFDWAYWLHPEVFEWTLAWSVVAIASLCGLYQLAACWSEGQPLEK